MEIIVTAPDARDFFTIVLDLSAIVERANVLHCRANKGGACNETQEKILRGSAIANRSGDTAATLGNVSRLLINKSHRQRH